MTATDRAPIRSWETDFDHGHPDFLDLPWDVSLQEWDLENRVEHWGIEGGD